MVIQRRITIVSIVGALLTFGSAVFAADSSSEVSDESEIHEHEHVSEHAEHGGHGDGHGNMNPLSVDPDLAWVTALIFVLLLTILWKFAWGPISDALDQREKAIAQEIETAKRHNEEARRLMKDHEAKLAGAGDEVRDLLDQARRDAESQRQIIVAEAQEAAKSEKDRALREIGLAKNSALHELAEKSVDTAVGLAGRIVHKQLKPGDHAELISDALAQFPKKS